MIAWKAIKKIKNKYNFKLPAPTYHENILQVSISQFPKNGIFGIMLKK